VAHRAAGVGVAAAALLMATERRTTRSTALLQARTVSPLLAPVAAVAAELRQQLFTLPKPRRRCVSALLLC
jgi:hypothetical protein